MSSFGYLHKTGVFFALIAIAAAGRPCRALDIPLKSGGNDKSGVVVGFVDMEKVFQDYPETRKAKNEYYQEISRRRDALAEQERVLAELREKLNALRASLNEADPGAAAGLEISSASLAAVRDRAAEQEARLIQEERALEDARRKDAQELKEMEETRSLKILGKLYQALVQIADEKGVSLVVDKSSILYGQQALDLTDALHRRVRGLPGE